MASKRYNFIFKDGCEYEVTLYEGGGIKIKDDLAGVVFENGRYRTLDIMKILDRLSDELKADVDYYDNPIEEIEEDERMQLNESEICDAMAKAVVDFVDDEFSDWTDEEKLNLKRLLITFSCRVRDCLVDAECKKLDKMAEAGE